MSVPAMEGGVPEENVNPEVVQAEGGASGIPECPICIERCVHPVELPCKHSFCFLCIKGVMIQAQQQSVTPKCSICRREIPSDFLTIPRILELAQQNITSNEYQWFYEARSGGWWQFEERHSLDLERAYTAQQTGCQLLIAGQLYKVDFRKMVQYRKGHRNLARRLKRDRYLSTAQRKGIAGIRTGANGDAGSSSNVPGGNPSGNHSSAASFAEPSLSGTPAQNEATTSEGEDSLTEAEIDDETDDDMDREEISEVDSDEVPSDDDMDLDLEEISEVDSDEVPSDDDMALEEASEEDSDEEDGDPIDSPGGIRDGAQGATSLSDGSTSSSNTNHTPKPLPGPVGTKSSAKGSGENNNGPTPSLTHHRSCAMPAQRPTVIVVPSTIRLSPARVRENSVETADEVL